MSFNEYIFYGFAGPTHHYGGLASGNFASGQNKYKVSYPKLAALQIIDMMSTLCSMGVSQAIIPPHPRPEKTQLYLNGGSVHGLTEGQVSSIMSSANMWAANAGTFTSYTCSQDQVSHITIANLFSNHHRQVEAKCNFHYFSTIFKDTKIKVHKALPSSLLDEGAANHMLLSEDWNNGGLDILVYGVDDKKYTVPRRQNSDACQQIILNHKILNAILVEQLPSSIDKGVFHNDVIAVSNKNLLLLHEKSFVNQEEFKENLIYQFHKLFPVTKLYIYEVSESDLSVEDAVSSYLFNSQIISINDEMLLAAPKECEQNKKVCRIIEKIIESTPITKVIYFDLKQSMQNGGGPACTRLRILLSENDVEKIPYNIFVNNQILKDIKKLVKSSYPDEITIDDFFKDEFYSNLEKIYEEFYSILGVPYFSDQA